MRATRHVASPSYSPYNPIRPMSAAMPVPQDAMELFRLLAERRVDYLLVGGLAMLP